MIVSKCFPSDENKTLMWIQHDMYRGGKGVGLLCGEAFRRYSKAVSLLSVTTELWEAINEHDSKFYPWKKKSKDEPILAWFDHRVLQSAHDTIAAWFRFCNPDLWLPLFPNDKIVRCVNRAEWRKFWRSEVKRLIDKHEIAIAVLTAIAYQNQKKGYAAEQELQGLLRLEYEEMFTADESNKET